MALRPCPECGREVSDQAAICPGCGVSLRPPVAPPAPASTTIIQEKRSGPFGWGFGLVFGCLAAVIGVPILLVVLAGMCSGITTTATGNRVFDAAAKTDLRNAMTAQEAYFSDNVRFASSINELDLYPSTGVAVTVLRGDTAGYEMTARHSSSDTTWCINSGVGEVVEGETC